MNPPDLSVLPFGNVLGIWAVPIVMLVIAWVLLVKGLALWKAARNGHKVWFIVLLIVNSIGILELIYIFWIAKKYTHEDETVEQEEHE